jgi:hypothetical protein
VDDRGQLAGVSDHRDTGREFWRRSAEDEEFLWLRLFRALDEVETAIAELERTGDPANKPDRARLERLREDLAAAAQLAARSRPRQG